MKGTGEFENPVDIALAVMRALLSIRKKTREK